MPDLIKCPDCGTTVSRRAATCTKCGRPIQEQARSAASAWALTLILLGVGFMGFLAVRNVVMLSRAPRSGVAPALDSASPDPAKIEILSWRPGPSPNSSDYFRAVGEIRNGNPMPVVVRLKLVVRGPDGTPNLVEEFHPSTEPIPPGGRCPFDRIFQGSTPDPSAATLEVADARG
jgi:hypothetical protein